MFLEKESLYFSLIPKLAETVKEPKKRENMGISQIYIKILEHPAVDATINFIKKFKSSKSYWSISYLILLFSMREAIAWKFGFAIKTF